MWIVDGVLENVHLWTMVKLLERSTHNIHVSTCQANLIVRMDHTMPSVVVLGSPYTQSPSISPSIHQRLLIFALLAKPTEPSAALSKLASNWLSQPSLPSWHLTLSPRHSPEPWGGRTGWHQSSHPFLTMSARNSFNRAVLFLLGRAMIEWNTACRAGLCSYTDVL